MTRRRRCRRREHSGLIRVPWPRLTLFCAALVLLLDHTGLARIGLLCAVLHEAGHLAVYWLLLHHLPRIRVGPTGFCLEMRGALLAPWQELALAAAGPMTNLLLCIGAVLWMEWAAGYSYPGYWFASANLLVGGVNLLPLPGLDGARILGCGMQTFSSCLHSRYK